jgi:hypothetical protein
MWLPYSGVVDLCVIIKHKQMKLQTSKQHLHNVLFCLVDEEIIDMKTFNDLLKLTLIESHNEFYDNRF